MSIFVGQPHKDGVYGIICRRRFKLEILKVLLEEDIFKAFPTS